MGILFVFLSNYFNVLSPQITGFIIDYVQESLHLPGYKPKAAPTGYALVVQHFIDWIKNTNFSIAGVVALSGIVILLLALLRGFFLFLMRQFIIVMSRFIEYDQKNEVYAHYQKLDTAFYKRNTVGDLMNRISEDVSRVRMFTGPAIMYFANMIAVISLAVFFMYKRDALLTLYVLAPLPILAITIYYVNITINKRSERIQESLSRLTTNAQESYSGIKVIKSFVQERAMLNFFAKNSETYRRDALSLAKVEAIYFPSITLLIGLSTLLTIMIGGLYYIYGTHDIGLDGIVEFVMYVNLLTFPVSAIGLTASMIQRASASQKRINEFLETRPGIVDKATNLPVKLDGNIRFDQVSLTYPDTGIEALSDFSLEIKKGEKVAIVGRSGSGKTTVAQLLLRLYDPTAGKVVMDGVDAKDIPLHNLRQQISYVLQDVFLFSDTVAENIRFSGKQISNERVAEAATLAQVHQEIMGLEKGYETILGERGVTLSGGQKQRVSIARALVKDPAVIIFDDCLSAVDSKTERAITSNLVPYLDGKTAIFITHRIFSMLHFDQIIVLENGRIIERGTHSGLLQQRGYYASMYTRQQEGEREERP